MNATSNKRGRKPFTKVIAVIAVLAAWVSVPYFTSKASANFDMSNIDRYASLSSPNGGSANGVAHWRLSDDGRRELEYDVFNTGLPAGTSLTASVSGNLVGTMTVNTFGGANLRLRTQDGQIVPTVNNGEPTEVRNGATILVNGVFGVNNPSPSPSVSPSGSPNGSPSPSGSPTPNGSPSPSVSPTPNGSPSPSVSPTPNGSPSPSVSPTPNSSPSPTVSPTPTGSPSPSPSPGGAGTFAALSGPVLNGAVPTGFGQYEIYSSRIEFEVRVRQVNLAIGTALSVVVNNAAAGTMFVESGGEARLRLHSDEGQNVPVITAGSTIFVTSANNGAILSGIFSGVSPTPSPSPSVSPSPSPSVSPTPAGRSFDASLTRAQASINTAANAAFTVTLNAEQTVATVRGGFQNLAADQTAAWVESEVGGGSIIRQLGTVGGRNGSFANLTFAITPIQAQMLRAGSWSMVVASAANPNGEVRGRLLLRTLASDFDGDGNHDLAVFRPSTNAWYMQNSAGFSYDSFGSANDKIVSGDYDGDGRTDVAMVAEANGQTFWNVKRSSDAGISSTQFGLAGDKPVRGDFDGDGRLDLAVYRPSNAVWYVQKSDNTGYIIVKFGLAEDKPMPADMDGDGKDDIAVWRPSTGIWYWIRSSDQQTGAMHFGFSDDIPVRGDFDGDGKSDIAVYRPSTGVWYIHRTSDGGYTIMQFGLNGDIPVAGHYDGDRKTDIAVFRPSDGNWYIMRSLDSAYQVIHFGLGGDKPVIAP